MINVYTYRFFLISLTIFALYQLAFFYLIRPYYYKKIFSANKEDIEIPEIAFEVLYLLILILGLALAPLVKMTPYLLWGVVFLVYSVAIRFSHQPFFLASALLFKFHRNLDLSTQLQHQKYIIAVLCLISAVIFSSAGILYLN